MKRVRREEFAEALRSRVLITDGAMGTQLQEKGLPAGSCPEMLNLTHPHWVQEVHRSYAELGVDILVANTFGGNRLKLSEYGLQEKVAEINGRGIALAREAAGERAWVAASIGPTGRFVEPLGDLAFEEAREVFREQVSACQTAGADLLLMETFSDIREMKAGIRAARELSSSIPLLCTMTFQENLRTVLGTGPEEVGCVLEALGADVVGANCGLGPERLYEAFCQMRRISRKPLIFQPNAGLPSVKEGSVVYPASPKLMATYAARFAREGANIVGSCCGATPAHVAAIVRAVRGMAPAPRRVVAATTAASRTRTVSIGGGGLPALVGERINPARRKELAQELRCGQFSWARRAAREQVQQGAALLDIHVGLSGVDEAELMRQAVLELQRAVDVPLMLDSSDPKVLEAGLKECEGKAILNSVNGKEESLSRILPLAKMYGAAVVGLTFDEQGVPQTARERLAIARRIVEAAQEIGIPKEDLLIDCLVMTVGAQQDQALETLEALRRVKEELGVATLLGISNVSHGLPQRSWLNAAFLSMALAAGLDAAIVDPLDPRVKESFLAGCVLAGRDEKARRYLSVGAQGPALGQRSTPSDPKETGEKDRLLKGILSAVVEGHREEVVPLVEEALRQGIPPLQISDQALVGGLEVVGRGFGEGSLFLPQVMLAAETVQAAFGCLKEELCGEAVGKVLLATVYGDIHDIGKNIVSTLLQNHGFEVFDLGKGVPAEEIYRAAEAHQADLVGLSALMTTTMPQMGVVADLFRQKGCPIPIMIGGAVVSQAFAEEIGAHLYAKDALEAVAKARKLMAQKAKAEELPCPPAPLSHLPVDSRLATVILAAGKGVRMRSEQPKVLHPLGGIPLVRYPVELSREVGSSRIVVVIGYRAEEVKQAFSPGEVELAEQREQLGSGHAVLQALPLLRDFSGEVLILSGDVPGLRAHTLLKMLQRHREEGAALTFLTTLPPDPSGYGRVARGADGRVLRVVEEVDATPEEKGLREINAGIYCCAKPFLDEALPHIERDNRQGEHYLTDLVGMAFSQGGRVLAFEVTDFWEVLGVNTPEELARMEEVLQSTTGSGWRP